VEQFGLVTMKPEPYRDFSAEQDSVQMRRVYFWNQKGNVRRHSMVLELLTTG